MHQIRIRKTSRSEAKPIDLRTASGRLLPY